MGHEYDVQPSVESESAALLEEREKAASSDSDTETKVQNQQDHERPIAPASKVDASETAKHETTEEGDILEERDESLPPRVKSEKVLIKEGVSKQVIKEGQGDGPPPRHSSCFGMLVALILRFLSTLKPDISM